MGRSFYLPTTVQAAPAALRGSVLTIRPAMATWGWTRIRPMTALGHLCEHGTIGDEKWHHVAMVYDGAAAGGGTLSLYIDHALDSQLTNAGVTWSAGSATYNPFMGADELPRLCRPLAVYG